MNPALDRVAQLADDMFTLVPPDAPGANFCGAMFTVSGQRFPAGAADVDPVRARVRCLGEIAETLAQFVRPEDLNEVPAGHGLDAAERSALDHLSGNFDGPWLAATRLSDGSTASVPSSLCLRPMGGTGVSSLGCAAGETMDGAIRSALFELIERDAVALWWNGGIPPMDIPEAALGETKMLLATARQAENGRTTRFLGLQSIGGVPAVCALSCDNTGKNMALGFGAAESFGSAASKALMELLQMEVGNRIVGMKAERLGIEKLSVADQEIRLRMTLLDGVMPQFQTAGTVVMAHEMSATEIMAKLSGLGVTVYAANLKNGDADVPVVKLIAPALQALPGIFETARLASAKKTYAMRLQHFPKVAIL